MPNWCALDLFGWKQKRNKNAMGVGTTRMEKNRCVSVKDHSQSSSPWGDCRRRWRKTAGRICPPRGADGLELLRRYRRHHRRRHRRCRNRHLHYYLSGRRTIRKKMNGDWPNAVEGRFRWWRYISAGYICYLLRHPKLQAAAVAAEVAVEEPVTAFRRHFGPAMSESSRPPNPAKLGNSSCVDFARRVSSFTSSEIHANLLIDSAPFWLVVRWSSNTSLQPVK